MAAECIRQAQPSLSDGAESAARAVANSPQGPTINGTERAAPSLTHAILKVSGPGVHNFFRFFTF